MTQEERYMKEAKKQAKEAKAEARKAMRIRS